VDISAYSARYKGVYDMSYRMARKMYDMYDNPLDATSASYRSAYAVRLLEIDQWRMKPHGHKRNGCEGAVRPLCQRRSDKVVPA
jgi:hypothetical protein